MILVTSFEWVRRAVGGGSWRACVFAAALVLALAACRGSVPVVSAPVVTPPAPRVDPLALPWTFRAPMTTRPQRVSVRAELLSRVNAVTAADSGRDLTRHDSLASVLDATLTNVARDGRAFEVQVSGFRVRVWPDTAWREPPHLAAPFAIPAAARDGEVPALCSGAAVSCAVPQMAAVQGWQELWLGAPRELRPGSTWRDSTTSVVLRDEIPLTVVSVRRFTVREARLHDGAVLLTIDRQSTQSLVGGGRQFGELVRLSGAGEGSMQLEVSLADGAILSGSGTSTLTMRLTGRRRVQDLTQTSQIAITAP